MSSDSEILEHLRKQMIEIQGVLDDLGTEGTKVVRELPGRTLDITKQVVGGLKRSLDNVAKVIAAYEKRNAKG